MIEGVNDFNYCITLLLSVFSCKANDVTLNDYRISFYIEILGLWVASCSQLTPDNKADIKRLPLMTSFV